MKKANYILQNHHKFSYKIELDEYFAYFLKEKNVKTRMPIIKKGENLYIGIFSVGAYQEIISGIGGVHHCMIPEGNELIIFKDKNDRINYYKAGTIQTTDKMLKILDYDKKDYIDLIWNNLE